MPTHLNPHGPLTGFGTIPRPRSTLGESTVSDLLYLAGGVAVFLLFAGYALLLKRT
jgi:hypothetical protein